MTYLDYLNREFPIRKTDTQKENFRNYVLSEMQKKGIDAKVEVTCDKKNKNVVIGDPLSAKYVCTAHYDTPARSLFPNLMLPRSNGLFFSYQMMIILPMLLIALLISFSATLIWRDDRITYIAFMLSYYLLFFALFHGPANKYNYNDNTSGVATVLTLIDKLSDEQKKNFAFILFDNEEKGKKGSKAYFKDHKEEMSERFLINFDCVGNGETIIFVAQKDAEKREEWHTLQQIVLPNDDFDVKFFGAKGSQCNSDQKSFPCGIA